jgi:hypothetical protein
LPRQNRVTPFGEIIADPGCGLFMGNRGVLHNADGTLAKARWRHAHWIICLTKFRGRRRDVMTPGRYTELFFSDEAAALAAGHRPCAECRRAAYNDFRQAWTRGHGADHLVRAPEIDAMLHRQRIEPRSTRRITYRASLAALPDGAFFSRMSAPDVALLKVGGGVWEWRFSGYTLSGELDRDARLDETVDVLTPRSSVAALAGGYRPVLHPSVAG